MTEGDSETPISQYSKELGVEQWKAILDSLKHIATLSTACIVAFGAIAKSFEILDKSAIKYSIASLILAIIFSIIAHVFYIATFARKRKPIETFIQGWALLFCWVFFIIGLILFAFNFY